MVHDSITGGKRVTTGRLVPFCLFTDPEFARVGLSEKEAKARMVAGLPYTMLRDALLTHPTLVEGLIQLFSSVPAVPKSAAAES